MENWIERGLPVEVGDSEIKCVSDSLSSFGTGDSARNINPAAARGCRGDAGYIASDGSSANANRRGDYGMAEGLRRQRKCNCEDGERRK